MGQDREEPGSRFYSLTALGRKRLHEEEESWRRLTEGVARVIRYA
jgi:hypothetical protein